MSSPPSPSRETPSPSGCMSALAHSTPRATVPPTSPSPHPHVKVPHVHSDEDEDEQAHQEAAVPHKRPCTESVHVGGLENDVETADSAHDQDVTMDPVKPPDTPTVFVYRSVYTTKPTWDRFVPVTEGPEIEVLGPHCVLRASGTEATAKVRNPQAHVLLKWKDPRPSMYISFPSDLTWAVYFQLKHEYFHFDMLRNHKTQYAEVMEWRDLYALQVPESDVQAYRFTERKAIWYAGKGKMLLGRLEVRVLRHARVVIPTELRRLSMPWFLKQFDDYDKYATYPFDEWHRYVNKHGGEQYIRAALNPVDMWEEGMSDEQVDKVIQAGLEANNTPASAFFMSPYYS